MNPKINRFAQQMQIELDNNKFKGDIFNWKSSIKEKLIDLEYHKAKLYMALKEENRICIKEYIADCANILLVIGNDYNLYDNDLQNTGFAAQMKEDLFTIVKVEDQILKKF